MRYDIVCNTLPAVAILLFSFGCELPSAGKLKPSHVQLLSGIVVFLSLLSHYNLD